MFGWDEMRKSRVYYKLYHSEPIIAKQNQILGLLRMFPHQINRMLREVPQSWTPFPSVGWEDSVGSVVMVGFPLVSPAQNQMLHHSRHSSVFLFCFCLLIIHPVSHSFFPFNSSLHLHILVLRPRQRQIHVQGWKDLYECASINIALDFKCICEDKQLWSCYTTVLPGHHKIDYYLLPTCGLNMRFAWWEI